MLTLTLVVLCSLWTSTIQLQDSYELYDYEDDGWTEFVGSNETEWSAFGGSDAHTGYKADYLSPINTIKTRWSFTLEGTLTYPVIHNGRVFVMSSTGVLHALDELTGIRLGKLSLGSGYSVGPPTVGFDGEDDLLYVQYVQSSSGGTVVYAVNITHTLNMQVVWQAAGESRAATYPYGVASSNNSEMVYFPGGDYANVLYGVNTSSGVVEFASTVYATYYGCDDWAPTVDDKGRLFFAVGSGEGSPGYLGQVNPENGSVIWTYPLYTILVDYSTHWVPVVRDNIILAVEFHTSTSVSLRAIHALFRTDLWTTDSCPVIYEKDVTPAVDDYLVFLPCQDGIQSFELLTGRPVAKFPPCDECFGQPIVTEEYLFSQSFYGIHAYNKTSGELLMQMSGNYGRMAYNAGSLYVSIEEVLYAYEFQFVNETSIAEE